MIAAAILDKEHHRRWWDFWTGVDLGRLQPVIDNHVAWIWDGNNLVAEFTPEQSPDDIKNIIEQLKG